jgi:cytochrome c peroxidase
LALYLYSLRPPRNPNRLDAAAARGRVLFEQEKCGECHTPPLYTNNGLVKDIGLDLHYTLETHKGTGYYKIPSLKGVWYRGPFGHHGSAATLADWFDPARMTPDYVPTGFKGYDGKTRGIPGHPFGLALSLSQRTDLIAFLNTL